MKRLQLTLLLLGGSAAFCSIGCKGSGSRDGGVFGSRDPEATPVARSGDPLFGDRIPKQNVPTRSGSSDANASRMTRDPLFQVPGRGEAPTERASKPEPKGSASANTPYPDPYRPSRDTTNAALAIAPDDSVLSVGPRRGSPATPTSSRGMPTYEQMVQELRRQGARIGEPTREKGNYVIRAEVPIDPDLPGPARWYEGFGNTPAVALRQIVEQVRGDRLR